MNQPLVSIIMLTYNGVQYIKAAITSVQTQYYDNWELIISDDGSTDGTWELAQVLGKEDQRIKCYQNITRLGIPKNRAQAFSYTTGDLICHLDGDDELFPYSLERMVLGFCDNPDVALIQSDSGWSDVKGKIFQYHANKDPEENLSHFGWRHFGMYRRTAYNNTQGYNTKLISACEDGDLFMQIAEKHKFMRLPEVLYKHRWHGENASKSNKQCASCTERLDCNFARVWTKHAKVDHATFKPLTQ